MEPSAESAQLWQSVYQELRRLAAQHLAAERRNHTLQATALVNEAFLRLRDDRSAPHLGHAAFCRAAAVAMRRVLLDHARARLRRKRAFPGGCRIDFDPDLCQEEIEAARLLDIEAALQQLEVISQRRAEIVRLRFFAGLTEEDVADVLGVSRRTVQYEFRSARAWLARILGAEQHLA